MTVGCLEPKFFSIFIDKFIKALPEDFLKHHSYWRPDLSKQYDRAEWPLMRKFIEEGFKLYGRDYWEKTFDGKFRISLFPCFLEGVSTTY